ncbi:MAG: nucleotidyl transferase AbiEii/AbiGii toxin family protein [Candidatus Magasanikbacteria bacterium]|nr:nucleotidyl transferase AbiEii/AbiGii toxin family protein [Candidatus Magasanikbacteria bacterium]
MHKEILTTEQVELFPLLKTVSSGYGLVGGTAIALLIGHRRSIDFDLFTEKSFRSKFLQKKIKSVTKIDRILVNKEQEFTFFAHDVKVTFYQYPFHIDYTERFEKLIYLPDLLTLAVMKAYALGRRAKWKDYVDLYFIIRDFHSLEEITKKAREIFEGEFNPKIFRTQLAYFDDINYEEKVEFLPDFEVSEKKIKKALVEFSLS